jgi:hypothetical protein
MYARALQLFDELFSPIADEAAPAATLGTLAQLPHANLH